MVAQYFAQIDENNIVTNVRVVEKEFLEANPNATQALGLKHFLIQQANNMLASVWSIYLRLKTLDRNSRLLLGLGRTILGTHRHQSLQLVDRISGTK